MQCQNSIAAIENIPQLFNLCEKLSFLSRWQACRMLRSKRITSLRAIYCNDKQMVNI